MKWATLSAALFLTACAGGGPLDYLRMRDIPPPISNSFTHCYNYGCENRETLGMPKDTQSKIDALFSSPSKNAEQEKSRIIKAVQIFEKDIGDIVGTKNDKRGTFRMYQNDAPSAKRFQQDCIDESTNTTIYLTLLNNMNYLHFHEPAFPANRQPFMSKAPWWHQTATIKNIETGERYAVDSWFEDNGVAGYIVPLQEWKEGWKPDRSLTAPQARNNNS